MKSLSTVKVLISGIYCMRYVLIVFHMNSLKSVIYKELEPEISTSLVVTTVSWQWMKNIEQETNR